MKMLIFFLKCWKCTRINILPQAPTPCRKYVLYTHQNIDDFEYAEGAQEYWGGDFFYPEGEGWFLLHIWEGVNSPYYQIQVFLWYVNMLGIFLIDL